MFFEQLGVHCHGTLPHGVRHRRGAGADHRRRLGVGQLRLHRPGRCPGLLLRLLADDATPLAADVALASAIPLAFASDTLSITVMEIVDNLIMLLIPGAMDAGPLDLLFWGSLAVALAIAFVAAYPVNRYLIARGKGHAVVHEYHHGGHEQHHEEQHDRDHQEPSHSR